MAGADLVTAQGGGNAVVEVQPGMRVEPVILVDQDGNYVSPGLSNPMTTLGDTIYGGAAGTPERLAGNTAASKLFYTSTGSGSAAAAPALAAIAAADLPAGVALLAGAAFTGAVSATESAAAGGILTVVNSHTTPTSPTVQYSALTAADLLLGLSVTGDTVQRFTADSNGKLSWGPGGSTATDTTLFRTSSSRLQAGAALFATTSRAAGVVLEIQNTSSSVPTAPNATIVSNAAGDPALGLDVSGDTVYRLAVDSNGKHLWGPGGSTAGDVNLYRTSAGVLKTDQSLTVAGTFTAAISGQFLCTPTSYAPAGQTVLTVTGATFAAFSSASVNTGSFTAPPSGSVWVDTEFVLETTVGSGTAVVIGIAAHGSTTPAANVWTDQDSSLSIPRTVSHSFLVTGLTPGTSYNFDLIGADGSGGSDAIAILAIGQTVSGTTKGGPVLMAVRAI
jgi:hypothetical protein